MLRKPMIAFQSISRNSSRSGSESLEEASPTISSLRITALKIRSVPNTVSFGRPAINDSMAPQASTMSVKYNSSVRIYKLGLGKDIITDKAFQPGLRHEINFAAKDFFEVDLHSRKLKETDAGI